MIMNSTLEQLKARGFFQQCSDIERLSRLMDQGPLTFYEGCDPTGSSLHIGHMVPYFAIRHLLAGGHKAVVLVGGGTARIGDPSGKTESRKILSYEQIDANAAAISAQLSRFFGPLGNTIQWANNKDWLADLNYIDFLREIGRHFSVNRMLSFEAYKIRMESGLSFIEFNYQLLQGYDFLQLYKRFGCRLQIGGDVQWGNIVAGIDLIRRVEGGDAFGLTFPLISAAGGRKMGKTEKGAVFLDPAITSPYAFFQYWRNVHDADIRRFLLMFTFLPIEECERLCAGGGDPNQAKERLAWEVTNLIHGKAEADKALAGARAAFGGGGDKEAMPSRVLDPGRFAAGYNIVDLFFDAGLVPSKSEGRRLVQQGGAFVGQAGEDLAPIADASAELGPEALGAGGELLLRAGKKRYCRILTAEGA
jgi:tyrosyl-tRNA synthetase